MGTEECDSLMPQLKELVQTIDSVTLFQKLAELGLSDERIEQIEEAIKANEVGSAEKIDVLLFLVKQMRPDEYERMAIKEHILSSGSLIEYDPAKNGQNIVKHGISFRDVISYSGSGFGRLLVTCPDEQEQERVVLMSRMTIPKGDNGLFLPFPKINEQDKCHVISIAHMRGVKIRMISSKVMSRKRPVKTINNALKNIYPDAPDKKEGVVKRCLEIMELTATPTQTVCEEALCDLPKKPAT